MSDTVEHSRPQQRDPLVDGDDGCSPYSTDDHPARASIDSLVEVEQPDVGSSEEANDVHVEKIPAKVLAPGEETVGSDGGNESQPSGEPSELKDSESATESSADAQGAKPPEHLKPSDVVADIIDDGRTRRKHEDESPSHPNWKNHRKHAFILTKAGKLLYSRYGHAQNIGLVPLSALFTAIISRVSEFNDVIRSITAGGQKFVFLTKGEFYVVMVAHSTETDQLLAAQCGYLYSQLLSLLTSGINKELAAYPNRDKFHMISGTEKYFDSLIPALDSDPEFLLNAVRCLPLNLSTREKIGDAMQAAQTPYLYFAVAIADNRLINVVRPKTQAVFPADLHLIFNYVRVADLRAGTSWIPLCLPNFNDSGYLYWHAAYYGEVCLLLISTKGDQDMFYTLQEKSTELGEQLEEIGALKEVEASVREGHFMLPELGIPNLLHFLYSSTTTSQLISPSLPAPYNSKKAKRRLHRLYQHVHQEVRRTRDPLNLYVHTTERETVVAWLAPGFELYVIVSCLVDRAEAIIAANRVLHWIKSKEERLLILHSPVWL